METRRRETFGGPWVLPVVQWGPQRYFVDLRLRQFRDVSRPHEFIDFDSELGRKMRRQSGIVVCPACGTSAMLSASDSDDLRCMRCFARTVACDGNRRGTVDEG